MSTTASGGGTNMVVDLHGSVNGDNKNKTLSEDGDNSTGESGGIITTTTFDPTDKRGGGSGDEDGSDVDTTAAGSMITAEGTTDDDCTPFHLPTSSAKRRRPNEEYVHGEEEQNSEDDNDKNNKTSTGTVHNQEPHQSDEQTTTANVKRTKEKVVDVPWGPVFYPTVEDMEGSPLKYLEKIKPVAERYGIAKIVPPKGWSTDFFAPTQEQMETNKMFSTKKQYLHRIQEGISFGDGEEYNPASYQRYASKYTNEYKSQHYPSPATSSGDRSDNNNNNRYDDDEESFDFSPENLEQDYWEIVENRSKREVVVEYGNDVDTNEFGSGFPLSERGRCCVASGPGGSPSRKVDLSKSRLPEPKFGTEDYYKETWWNLNNMPNTPDSVLRHVKVGINGINVPWMYYGSLFTTFCWHNEDNYLYSINYHHKGAPKQWYGVPGTQSDAEGLERVFKYYLSSKMRDIPDLLHHITTQFSPRLLQKDNVPIYKLLQHEGEYVVTFPRAFHGGFSYGPNIGEAVNFATHDWITHGSDANERYRSFARPAVFSHDRLTFTMAHHVLEQESYKNCMLLLEELERVVHEELSRRKDLISTGVRDVSDLIELPPNRLDQLDEESAVYDDKRLCHSCKHICFFSAVACECSQSKVSCLRHSNYMCRCPASRRYLIVWSPEEELLQTCRRVKEHCETLKSAAPAVAAEDDSDSTASHRLPPVAPGVEEDLERHKNDIITVPAVYG